MLIMMLNPPQPAELSRDNVIFVLDLSVTEPVISPDLALRVGEAGASMARAWLAMQANHGQMRA